MGKFNVIEDLEMRTRGGVGGGGTSDDSDDLADMRYSERLVLSKDFLEALAQLKVAKVVDNHILGGTILIPRTDIEGYEGKEITGAVHSTNRVFVALEIPFYATSYASDGAEKIRRTAKRGKDIGKEKNVTIPDTLRVYRISESFDKDLYACNGSKKVTEEGVHPYHQPTDGMLAREEKWVEENGTDPEIYELLKKVGVDLAVETGTETGTVETSTSETVNTSVV